MKHLFLLFGFLLAAFTAQAATQKGVKPDNGAELYYNLYDDRTAEIVRNPNDYSSVYSMKSLAIPATVTYNDVTYDVTTIATNAFLNSTIESISGGANITTIGGTVFGSNSTLTSINLDGKVTSIGSSAFNGCASLTSIGNILDNVTEIPHKVFYGCTALTGTIIITAPITSIGEDVFNGCTDSNLSVSFTNLTDAVISQRAFYEFTGLKSVAGTVKSIGNIAFYNCTNFEKLELYNTTTPPTLGSDVFKNSSNLTVYVHPDILASYQAADGWKDLSLQTLPEEEVYYNVTPADGKGLKYNLNTLGARGTAQIAGIGTCVNEVVIPAKITHDGKTYDVTGISDAVFRGTSITKVSGGENITSIGVSAFQGCSNLTSIGHLLDNVTDIPSTAFSGCSALTGEITLNAAITNIGESAFEECNAQNLSLSFTNLTDATIGKRAFYKCTRLKSIEGTAASIGKEAFYGCTNLTSIGNLLDNVTDIPSKAFYSCSALTGYITLNAAITNIGESAFYNCTNQDLSLSFTNLTNATIGESAFRSDRYGDYTGLNSIAGTAKSIGVSAFQNCSNLASIGHLLDNVTYIPDFAFYRCSSLTGEITLNAEIHYIGEYAFIESGISNIYCLKATPPNLGDLALGENALSVKVPSSAVSDYESAWGTSYSMDISAGDPTSATTAANSGSTTHWATFSNTYSDSELSVEAGKTLTLYNATVADGKLTLTERTGSQVAKGEAVLIKTDAETVNVTPLSTTSLVKAEDNDLLATPEYATILHTQDGCKYYRLTYNNATDKTGLGFYLGVATVDGVKKTDGTYLNASPYKAYLKVTVEAATEPSTAKLARGFAFPGDDETTGIECTTVTDESLHRNGNAEGIFDLQGRKVSKPTKGVYIKNNKLFLN